MERNKMDTGTNNASAVEPPPPPGFQPEPPPPSGFSADPTPPPGFQAEPSPPPGFQAEGQTAQQQPTDNTGLLPSLSDAVHGYIQSARQRIGASPSEFGAKVVGRLSDLVEGANHNVSNAALTIEKLARDIDKAHGIYTNGHPLDADIANAEQIIARQRKPANAEQAGNMQLGDDTANILQYIGGEGIVKAMPLANMLETLGPIKQALTKSPIAAKVLRQLIEQGITGTVQSTTQGATPGEAVGQGVLSGAMGALSELPGARVASRANLAEELAPIEKEAEGVPYNVLRSEVRGPQGQTIATPLQQEAATIGESAATRAMRQEAFPQVQTNIARRGLETALNTSNDASVADLRERLRNTDDPQLETELSQQLQNIRAGVGGVGGQVPWSYISPEGTALSPGEARSTLQGMREHWLSQDWTPDEEEHIQNRYNDLKDQLDRYDNLGGTQPISPIYNVRDAVDNSSNFGDAANHMRLVADRAIAEMPQVQRERYQDLADSRAKLQDQFDSNAGVPRLQTPIMREMEKINDRMTDILNDPQVADRISGGKAEQALTDKRLSDAFSAIQNVMSKHVSIPGKAAAAANIPSEAQNMSSLTSDIEAIKNKYGDVLNPVLGEQGLNHLVEMGHYMDMPEGRERINTLKGNIAMVLRRHFMGLRGMAMYPATAVAATLAHVAGHLAGVGSLGAVGLAGLAGEAQAARTRFKLATDPVYARMIRDRLTSEPAFANRFLFGAKNVPSRHAAPLLASSMLTWLNGGNEQPPEPPPTGDANAPSR
jgi:hypothetical protein